MLSTGGLADPNLPPGVEVLDRDADRPSSSMIAATARLSSPLPSS